MEKVKNILGEIHLYADKEKLMVRYIIWAISWLGGIYAISNTQDKRALASAYLIFALSLLMEFGSNIKKKKEIFSRVVDGVFCFAVICILLMAVMVLVGAPLLSNHYKTMYEISKGIMIFMVIDFFITWICPEYIETEHIKEDECNQKYSEIEIFQDKLRRGNLGVIHEGGRNE